MTDDHSGVEAVKIPIMLRESIARIIDPVAWKGWDEIRQLREGSYGLAGEPEGRMEDPTCARWQHMSWPGERSGIVRSLAKADAVLSVLESPAKPTPTGQDKLVGELVDGEADSLAHNLALRDRFIVERGLWSAFVDQFLPAARARQPGSAEQ